MKNQGLSPLQKKTRTAFAAGVFVSVLLLTWFQQAGVALLIGALVALLVARPERPVAFARIGFAIGTIAGPLAGSRRYLGTLSGRPRTELLPLVAFLFAGMLWGAALCGFYGFLSGALCELARWRGWWRAAREA